MRIVWSYWSKPAEKSPKIGSASPWPDKRVHLLSWILSVRTASKHPGYDTRLVTDDEGKRLLVDVLGLQFGKVTTELNELSEYDAAWWALGKIRAYRAMDVPFVHVDSDVFLWSKLPEELEAAAVLGQNPEHFDVGGNGPYTPEQFETLLLYQNEGWLPKEWLWYRAVFPNKHGAVCCGIYGGTNLAFIHHCADQAFEILNNPINKEALKATDDQAKGRYIMLLEQFLPVACMEYHTDYKYSRFHKIHFSYLFHSIEDAYCRAFRTGFTHLISNSKEHQRVVERLEPRVRKEYPDEHKKLEAYLAGEK